MTTEIAVGPCSPFFIVSNVATSAAYYVDKLGFQRTAETDAFAIVVRGSAQIMMKVVGENTAPLPNSARHEDARWDAFIFTQDPDALFAELTKSGATFQQELRNDDDNLRGFETVDTDGYICFFGRPA